jgi:cytochrome oxidase assembly protein ShyY1
MADPGIKNHLKPSQRSGQRSIVFAVVALTALGLLFVSLGNWQLNRAQERREIAQALELGRQEPTVTLTAQSDVTALLPWQPAEVSGYWLAQWSVLLDNRSFNGAPGFWLTTPLQLSSDTAVLVLRGWVPRPIAQHNPFVPVLQSTAAVRVSGEIALRVPRLYELAQSEPLPADPVSLAQTESAQSMLDLNLLPQRQNLTIDEISKTSGLQFLPVVLMQTSPVDGAQLERDWPTPSVDANTNVGYAIQWFSFAAIAFGALGVLVWRIRRREKI